MVKRKFDAITVMYVDVDVKDSWMVSAKNYQSVGITFLNAFFTNLNSSNIASTISLT